MGPACADHITKKVHSKHKQVISTFRHTRHTHIPPPGTLLELTLKLDFAAAIRLRLKADAGEHGKDAALEVLRAAEVEFPDDDARHVGDPKDCVRHVCPSVSSDSYAKMRTEIAAVLSNFNSDVEAANEPL